MFVTVDVGLSALHSICKYVYELFPYLILRVWLSSKELICTVKQETKYRLLQLSFNYLNSLKVISVTQVQYFSKSVATLIVPTSQLRMSAMLLLVIVGK
jgi:hypothetical protein